MEREPCPWYILNMAKYLESKYQPLPHLEELVLDLQVVLADLQNSADMFFRTVNFLREQGVLALVPPSPPSQESD